MFVSPERGRGTVKLRRYRAAHAVNQKEPHPCGSGYTTTKRLNNRYERAPSVRIRQNLPPEIDARFRKSPIRADRALRSAHLRHAECALYLRLSFVFIIHALEALYDLNNYDC